MPPEPLLDPTGFDLSHVVADLKSIREVNPQRFEMEQLTAIVLVKPEQHLIVGYKDVREDEFWVRGHLPGLPLMPGVLMCEAAAQLCSYYSVTQHQVAEGDFVGFGGLENVRFRAPVRIGDRLVLMAKGVKMHRKQTLFNVQGFVKSTMVFHADVIGVPLSRQTIVSGTARES
jgi:3-hydroxyacyl-[acyl-carrier-protein] dehydratase